MNEVHEQSIVADLEVMLQTSDYFKVSSVATSPYLIDVTKQSKQVHEEILNLETARQESMISAALLGQERMESEKLDSIELTSPISMEHGSHELSVLDASVSNAISKLHARLETSSCDAPSVVEPPRRSLAGFPTIEDLERELELLSG